MKPKVEMLRTSQEWLELYQKDNPGFEIMDPDGWDRENFEQSWGEHIPEVIFKRRMMASTCRFPERKK